MYRRILIANRGEIACRVARTCRRLGIESVAVYSDADRSSQHTKLADKAFDLGGSEARESYLDIDKIIRIAKRAKADAIHPGYGFLSENAQFAQRIKKEGLTFIGPTPAVMRALGDKIEAKKLAKAVKVPLVPGHLCEKTKSDALVSEIRAFADSSGFPLLLKAAAGGGGRGMRRVNKLSELQDAVTSAQREAEAAFGDSRIFVERLIERARHVEVQIIGDRFGNVFSLYDRDCSMQRNHQKVIEEAPAPNIPDTIRKKIHAAARRLCQEAGYSNAGTVEFLLDPDGNFFFLEVNSRLQVEHPVTESILGLDLVELQLRVAAGDKLSDILSQDSIQPQGAAIELRLCAEVPSQGFIASTGTIEHLEIAKASDGGPVRLDSGFVRGDYISHYYDSLMAKIVVHRRTRAEALQAAKDIAANSFIAGVKTNLDFLSDLLGSAEFNNVTHYTRFAQTLLESEKSIQKNAELAAAIYLAYYLELSTPRAALDPWQSSEGWRLSGPSAQNREFTLAGRNCSVSVTPLGSRRYKLQASNLGTLEIEVQSHDMAGMRYSAQASDGDLNVFCGTSGVWLKANGTVWDLKPLQKQLRGARNSAATENSDILSPLPGKIVAVRAKVGDKLKTGDPIVILESMKMEHIVRAPRPAELRELRVKCGDVVEAQSLLAALHSDA
ncbi:MAG: ATP-grasp domain-containing protein [Oligoflexia bacterium]|nr:ATP-grasp domain-containing protein [Oligoflexia bacterium]